MAAPGSGLSLTVQTTSGAVAGKIDNASRQYLGIPYAQPPVGELRWQPPQPVVPWSGVRPATAFGPACPQDQAYLTSFKIRELSEDCLSLNILAPAKGENLPVMVSIHGGGFMAGAGSLMLMAAPALSAEGVVLVTFNYRLGALGYFAHPLLESEAGVNFGLMDMIAALEWLQANIAAFGGDPARMTIEGLSAGGQAVHMLMVTPASAGLFVGAVAESGYGAWPRQPRTLHVARLPSAPSAESIALDLATRATGKPVHAITPDALYAIPPEKLVQAVTGFHVPIVDGKSLPEEPATLFARGEQHPVPLLAGGPIYDGNSYPYSGVTDEELWDLVGDQSARMKALWASDFEVSEAQGLTRFFGDIRYLYSAWNLSRNMQQVGKPGYLYLFDFVSPGAETHEPGAGHGTDVGAMWGDHVSPTPAAMRSYWVNFIRTGNPNGAGLVNWPTAAAGASTRWLLLGDTIRQRDDLAREKMIFLDELWRTRVATTL